MNLEDVNFDYFPLSPYKNKDWVSAGHLLGTGTIATQNRVYLSCEEAKKVIHKLGIKSIKEWNIYCKSGNKPDNIPNGPHQVYKNKGWKSWGDFLGTGYIANRNRTYLSCEEAKKVIHKLGIKSKKEWHEHVKSGKNPNNIPNDPCSAYKNKGWKGWGDWLGTGTIANQNRVFLSCEEAKKVIHKLGIKSQKEWKEYCKSGNKPDNIPNDPCSAYKNKGWKGWGDFLGTGYIANRNRTYLSCEEAKKVIHKLGIKSKKEWQIYSKSERPDNIPSSPNRIYKNKGWKGFGDWLGTGYIATFNRVYLSCEEAKKVIHKLGIKSQKEWYIYCKSGNKPDNIPSSPRRIYKNKGWEGWKDFLGY